MPKRRRVRPLAICVFRHNNHILVAEGYDPVRDQHFYRPLGGGIEFGEPSYETVRRELLEEIQAEVNPESLVYLGTLENIFTFNGIASHEIILIYDGVLKQSGLYDQAVIVGKEANGEEIRAVWKNIADFGEGESILYPTGLLEMLVDV